MSVQVRYLDTQEAAKYCGIKSVRTLEGWRRDGRGPAYHKVSSKCVRYKREDLDSFMDAFRVMTIDDARQ